MGCEDVSLSSFHESWGKSTCRMVSSTSAIRDPPAYKEIGIQHISPNSGRKIYTPVMSASIKPNKARELTFIHKKMLDDLANINIGRVKSFNRMRTMYGGFDIVGTTMSDYKNYKRNINLYIRDYDTDMAVQRLMAKTNYCPNFSCDYFTSTDGALKDLFWVDERAKTNFYVFGDVVSFDATYRHSKHNLVFFQFTGIDNLNRNVTLGKALLGSETAKSYIWLLRCFMRAFGYEPAVVVTDQDLAMKHAVEDVFPNSRQRLFMWHIMDKLSMKVGSNLCNTIDFKSRLCDFVWTDSITPGLFVKERASIMNDFQLNENDWLEYIFHIRQSWIPAYYQEDTMSDLMHIRVFPKQCINSRWTKDVVSDNPMRSIGFDEPNIDKSIDVYRVVRDINIAQNHIINNLVTDMEKLQHYHDNINQ
ncbi:protein FAR1-RELATED SEQUENCE 5-like [Bidens hawaiensis]|uniref:protein FAR1-RELATED SEQUENCE 5-like n=1 Tax=Bidens hawaiensis TaxID=980011 RepID=UPI00404923AF